jgi:hypothetical protein
MVVSRLLATYKLRQYVDPGNFGAGNPFPQRLYRP